MRDLFSLFLETTFSSSVEQKLAPIFADTFPPPFYIFFKLSDVTLL